MYGDTFNYSNLCIFNKSIQSSLSVIVRPWLSCNKQSSKEKIIENAKGVSA